MKNQAEFGLSYDALFVVGDAPGTGLRVRFILSSSAAASLRTDLSPAEMKWHKSFLNKFIWLIKFIVITNSSWQDQKLYFQILFCKNLNEFLQNCKNVWPCKTQYLLLIWQFQPSWWKTIIIVLINNLIPSLKRDEEVYILNHLCGLFLVKCTLCKSVGEFRSYTNNHQFNNGFSSR